MTPTKISRHAANTSVRWSSNSKSGIAALGGSNSMGQGFTVLDTINRRGWIKRYPYLLDKGEGLLLILDPAQINSRPDIPNNSVYILRPDNTKIELPVSEIEINP